MGVGGGVGGREGGGVGWKEGAGGYSRRRVKASIRTQTAMLFLQ